MQNEKQVTLVCLCYLWQQSSLYLKRAGLFRFLYQYTRMDGVGRGKRTLIFHVRDELCRLHLPSSLYLDEDAIFARLRESIKKGHVGAGSVMQHSAHAVAGGRTLCQVESSHGHRTRRMNMRENFSVIAHEHRVSGHAHIAFYS